MYHETYESNNKIELWEYDYDVYDLNDSDIVIIYVHIVRAANYQCFVC